ncbi:MAG TPA: hypothetical protein PKM58_12840, partial [Pyrinomonadaceae bacterium]|nr:hypothetical protein [Pyrinomonadaceae bacterium]
MLNEYSYTLPAEFESALTDAVRDWNDADNIDRIWRKDATVWTGSDEWKWLGWLDIVDRELEDLGKYREFAADAEKFDDIVLLGMGGSSLCPEVLSLVFAKQRFHVLDSTVPAQVAALEAKLDLANTLFIVSSKSGSTLEPNCFKQYFFERVARTIGAEAAGSRFVTITDPGSKMEKVANADKFRRIFFGDPEIGGRFSAMSVFGLAPGAAMGLELRDVAAIEDDL